MRVGGTIMQWGPVPPPRGPIRQSYLDSNGRQELETFERQLSAALRLLDPVNHASLEIHPRESGDDVARMAQHSRLRAHWSAIRSQIGRGKILEAEPHIRAAERAAVRALNYLEDNALADTTHGAVHQASQLRRGLLGCPIQFRDGAYWTTCPFSLAHIRVGFSAGITGTFVCSVCGSAIEDCDHLPGTEFDHVARNIDNDCNVCHQSTCDHVEGEIYTAAVTPIGVDFSAHEVSIVPRPMYPQARFGEIEVTDDLDHASRVLAASGRLHCDECFGPCEGLLDARTWGARVGLPIS